MARSALTSQVLRMCVIPAVGHWRNSAEVVGTVSIDTIVERVGCLVGVVFAM